MAQHALVRLTHAVRITRNHQKLMPETGAIFALDVNARTVSTAGKNARMR